MSSLFTSAFANDLVSLRQLTSFKETNNQSPIYREYHSNIKDFNSLKIFFERKQVNVDFISVLNVSSLEPIFYEELISLYYYTRGGYRDINSNLRVLNKYIQRTGDIMPRELLSKKDLSNYLATEALAMVAVSGLNKIEGKKCKAIRSTNLDIKGQNNIFKQIKDTFEFSDMGFLSAESVLNTNHRVGRKCGNNYFSKSKFKFIISSNSCKDISWISKYRCENEVLFPPGAKFIVNRIDEDQLPIKIYMTHLE
jgi:hypothetical protein